MSRNDPTARGAVGAGSSGPAIEVVTRGRSWLPDVAYRVWAFSRVPQMHPHQRCARTS